MRKLKIFEHISIDGVVQHTPDENDFAYSGWTVPFRSPEGLAKLSLLYGETYDVLLGRRSYDILSGFWPTAPSSPVADRLNAGKKFVATHRPEGLTWGPYEIVGPDLVDSLRRIKSETGPDIIVLGSSTLISPLLEAGMVDELIVSIFPVVIGTGKRLFSGGIPQTFEFVSTETTPTGVVISRYTCKGPLQSS
jgi:dihydrofolate reductase